MRMLREIIWSTWPACTAPDPDDAAQRPFTADAIISNPPVYGHFHVAEALRVPLHMMFPQPWCPTKAFPHPLSNELMTRGWSHRNRISYRVVDEVQSSEWMLQHTKACPRCHTATEKNGGCNHITCRHCNFEWCWLCSCKYQPGHYRGGACEQFSDDFFAELELTREEFDDQYEVIDHW